MPRTEGIPQPPAGAVLVCPQCKGACRIGSPYYLKNLGQCERCKITMGTDVDLARVARRTRLYEFRD